MENNLHKKKIYGILVVYYPKYAKKAIFNFNKFMIETFPNSEVIIVNNNENLNLAKNHIKGDNTNFEFSGWDSGLENIIIEDEDLIVFANDTFCNLESWNYLNKIRYIKSFKKLDKSSEYLVCGEISKFPGTYEIDKYNANFWVRTNIFAMKGKVIRLINKLSMEITALNSIVGLNDKKDNLLWKNKIVGDSLKNRINDWVFPKNGQFGWYGAKNASPERKLKKAHSVINEKWLSARLSYNEIKIIDCSQNKLIKFYRRLRSKYNQLILKK